jgi:signal transduction histidine kinase/ActR/RegA family two-component response regulator/HPt (histidine-containing phosphotransfer) domain-containing protein
VSEAHDLSKTNRFRAFRYVAALVPAVALLGVAVLINAHHTATDRAQRVADHARFAAASVDLRLGQLLELTAFCTSSPALINRVDLANVAENCGRYAGRIGAWVVIVETGETHRQILNTRTDVPAVLPAYPRTDEHATLRALEDLSRASGEPGIADVFTGIILPEGIVSAGQYLRLADGRDAMLYVSVGARTLSDQLAGIAAPEGPIFGLIDPSRRVVARSVGIERAMFADAPDWILGFMDTGAAGAALGVPGPEVIGGTWDAGYHPSNAAPGWMAAAFQPTPVGTRLWAPISLPSAVVLVGLLLSGALLWGISGRDRAARREEAARQAEAEAERRDREKSRLLASFAHDIRSPLISLIGSLEMIETGRGPGRDAMEMDRTGQIRLARGAAEALLQLVDDILELSFLGSGEMSLHPSPADLRQLAATLSDQLRQRADQKGLYLRLDLDPGLPPIVEVDRLRLQQILSNLLTNAVKYTERGGVTLRIRVSGAAPGRMDLDLAVIDTGVGLAPEDIPRILREFGRLEREVEQRETGSGLGLAIVQRILHSMGTVLEVESKPGQGSTFRFRLTVPVPTDGAKPSMAQPLAGTVILYAEDEPVIRQVTERRLAEAGAQVVSTVDGEDALRQLASVTPDLLLIDLQMPGLDGVGLIRRLQEVAPTRSWPIFVLTSHISGHQAAEARAAGADEVFTKPVQVAALAAAFQARRGNGGQSVPRVNCNAEAAFGPVLDLEAFLAATGPRDAPYAAALVARFEASIREDCAAFESMIAAADTGAAARLAHRCFGLCQVFGAAALARHLLRLEEEAAAGNVAEVRALAADCETLAETTLSEMRAAIRVSGAGGS